MPTYIVNKYSLVDVEIDAQDEAEALATAIEIWRDDASYEDQYTVNEAKV